MESDGSSTLRWFSITIEDTRLLSTRKFIRSAKLTTRTETQPHTTTHVLDLPLHVLLYHLLLYGEMA